METTFKCDLASRGWHVYGKTVWANPKEGEILYAEKEQNKIALMHDPYSVAWKIKSFTAKGSRCCFKNIESLFSVARTRQLMTY